MALNSKLQTILLKAKEDVYSHLSGENLSHILGEGYDFAELREYESSDDVRHISWINSAKLGKPYVKKMHEERELNVAVCSIFDGRFLVGKKQELLTYIVAILAYSSYEANDFFSPSLLLDSKLKHYEATKNIYAIENYLAELGTSKLLGKKSNYRELSSLSLNAKHLLFLVGDFLEEVDLSILAQKHELVVVIIRDREEENPQMRLDEQLINPQTNQVVSQTLNKRAIKYYKAKLEEHDRKLYEHFYAYNIRFIKVYEEGEILKALSQSLSVNN